VSIEIHLPGGPAQVEQQVEQVESG